MRKKILLFLIILLLFLNILVWTVIKEESNYLEVVYFNVGQGDSIFIEFPSEFQVLIDGGPDLTVLEKLGKEMPFYDRSIDLVVLTHPDSDHLFGLIEVLKRYEIKNILWSGGEKDTALFKEWSRLIEEEGANIIIADSSKKIYYNDISITTLYPLDKVSEANNDTSVVLELKYRDVSFLFTGDISCKIEKEINIDTDVLKVAHHGSKTSTCKYFLEKTSPELAVISVGENNWNHPHPDVLANLKEFGIKTLITRDYGDVKIISDGNNFIINK